ncbi:hypothetical protein AVEN_151827-1 [Araneus ventricosus]|uniref:Uncharacterized protein n=1 Tax=Araneus ventricosus TaxID=182803 RepID=A0A4Y2MSF7_ARAVE|nr:hypothetical protein AVEN_151827-1 [Araneus ventricosus]
MQNGDPPHVANPVKRLLSMHFGNDRIISRHFPTNWPPRSPDLTPCDFCLWGYLNHVVFSGPIANLAELKTLIALHFNSIIRNTIRSVVEHSISRFELVAENGGEYIEHFLRQSWSVGFQLRSPKLSNDWEIIVLFIDFFSKKPLQSCALNSTDGSSHWVENVNGSPILVRLMTTSG